MSSYKKALHLEHIMFVYMVPCYLRKLYGSNTCCSTTFMSLIWYIIVMLAVRVLKSIGSRRGSWLWVSAVHLVHLL